MARTSSSASVIEPWMRRNPLAVATMVYIPAATSNLNVPSGLALTAATKFSSGSYKRTVTTLDAITSPVRTAPEIGVAVDVTMDVDVNVGVNDSAGVGVNVAKDVGVSVGVCEVAGVLASVEV